MFFTVELQSPKYTSRFDPQGLFKPSKRSIRDRKIALHDENMSSVNRQGAAA